MFTSYRFYSQGHFLTDTVLDGKPVLEGADEGRGEEVTGAVEGLLLFVGEVGEVGPGLFVIGGTAQFIVFEGHAGEDRVAGTEVGELFQEPLHILFRIPFGDVLLAQ